MKTEHVKTASLAFLFGIAVSLLLAITAYAASKNYHGLTTVYYSNKITDQGGGSWNWNGSYADYTSPSFSMDQFGLNFWSTWCSCDYDTIWDTYIAYDVIYDPWLMRYNQTAIWDGMAQQKTDCEGEILRGHNYIQHWWQDGGYSGDGGTLNTNKILANP
jgi:hypothetical protein